MVTFTQAQDDSFSSISLSLSFSLSGARPAGGAVNSEGTVMSVWKGSTATSAATRIYGRIDDRDMTNVLADAAVSNTTSASGGVVASTQFNDGFVVMSLANNNLYYRRYTKTGTARDANDVSLGIGNNNVGRFDVGMDDDGDIYFIYGKTGDDDIYMQRRDDDGTVDLSEVTLETLPGNEYQPSIVHPASGRITIPSISNNDTVSVYRFDKDGSDLGSVTVTTSATNITMARVVARYGDDGFTVFWTRNSVQTIFYRGYDSSGSPRYAEQSYSNLGNPDFLRVWIGQRPFVDTNDYSIYVAVQNLANRIHMLDNAEPPNVTDDVYTLETPFNAFIVPTSINEYEFRNMYKGSLSSDPVRNEVVVSQSAQMSLWKKTRDTRVFRDGDLDPASKTQVENIYTNAGKLAGTTTTDTADYESLRSVTIASESAWTDFLGSADEDTIFIGGPESAEAAQAMHNNTDLFDAQITSLGVSEIGMSAFSWLFGSGRTESYGAAGVGSDGPGIQITNSHGTFTLERQLSGNDNIDYAVLLRIPVSADSTQDTKTFWYVAGINGAGTEAAAYVMDNFEEYQTGKSNSILLRLTYPASIKNVDGYTPGSTGTIEVFAMEDVNSNDYSG